MSSLKPTRAAPRRRSFCEKGGGEVFHLINPAKTMKKHRFLIKERGFLEGYRLSKALFFMVVGAVGIQARGQSSNRSKLLGFRKAFEFPQREERPTSTRRPPFGT